MVLFSVLTIASAMTPDQGVVQIWVDKQQIHSVALGRLAEDYEIPLYFQLPTVQEWGTGISIGEQLILTNYHVVQGARGLGIQTPSSDIIPAKIISVLPDFDLAWLRLEEELPLESWASEFNFQKNDPVWTGGFAVALSWSEKQGTIIDVERGDILSDERQYFSVIDQVVEPGYSGGPVWNEEKKLIGMMTATNREKNEAYFIPLQEIENAWEQLQAGDILWGDIGIRVLGNKIVSVNPYSPAGDLPLGRIEQLQGKNVSENVLHNELRRIQTGQTISLTIDGKEYSVAVLDFSEWGKEKDSCFWNKAYLKRETKYWRIVSLNKDSPLRQMGARPNDLLQIDETCRDLYTLNLRLVPIEREDHIYQLILPKHYMRDH